MTGSVLFFSVLLAAISDCAYVLAVGVMLAGFWLDEVEMLPARSVFSAAYAGKWLIGLGTVIALVQIMRLWFLAASMSGATLFQQNLALVPSIVSSTHQGLLWKVQMGAVLAFLASSAAIARRRSRAMRFIGVVCLCVIAFVKAASGHAADNGDFTRQEMLQWMHILSTAAWAGGVIVSGLLVLPVLVRTAASEMVWQYLQTLSKVATYAVLAVFVSGIYTADREINGMFADLFTSTWGRILIGKVVIVLFALVLGAANRFFCLRGDVSMENIMLSGRLLRVEAIAILVVLCLSAWLGNTAPAMQMS
jgi:putative copper resistance protein D